MKVVFGRRALNDIGGLFDHIAQDDLDLAMAVESDIRQACEGLEQFPYANMATHLSLTGYLHCPIYSGCQHRRASVERARLAVGRAKIGAHLWWH